MDNNRLIVIIVIETIMKISLITRIITIVARLEKNVIISSKENQDKSKAFECARFHIENE